MVDEPYPDFLHVALRDGISSRLSYSAGVAVETVWREADQRSAIRSIE